MAQTRTPAKYSGISTKKQVGLPAYRSQYLAKWQYGKPPGIDDTRQLEHKLSRKSEPTTKFADDELASRVEVV